MTRALSRELLSLMEIPSGIFVTENLCHPPTLHPTRDRITRLFAVRMLRTESPWYATPMTTIRWFSMRSSAGP